MEKPRVVDALCSDLEEACKRMLEAARKTEQAATDPESRAEGKYDTRGLEASYLAAGQSEQLEEMTADLRKVQQASFPDFSASDEIAAGALVELKMAGERDSFLLAPAAGGHLIEIDDSEVTVLAPGAPLREKLVGLRVGDSHADPPFKVVAVR